MTRFGVQLVVYAFISELVLQLVMLVKFLARSQRPGPSLGELFHFLFCSTLSKPYRNLLVAQGIQPTLTDELLHRVSILLLACLGIGLVLVIVGLFWAN